MPLADTAATATACQVAPSTIRKWAMRGWLTQHGTPRRRLYDLDEATQLAQSRRTMITQDATENDNDLLSDTDARHWAERFASKFPQVFQDGEGVVTDVEGLMLTWFACAIETGRSAGYGQGRDAEAAGEPG